MGVVKGGHEWKWLNLITVRMSATSKKPQISVDRYDVDEDIEEDPKMLELVNKYHRIAEIKYSKEIAQMAVDLDATEECCRFCEGTLPNWICDVIAEDYSEKEGLQSADIGLLMGFTFAGKKLFKKGPLTLGDTMCIFPKECIIVVLKLTGEDIVKSLTRGCKSLPGECGALHHCSSRLSYKITVTNKKETHNRVTDVLFDGKPIDLKKTYTVACTEEMAKGKFGYTWMGTAQREIDEEDGMQIQDIIKMWCKRHVGESVHPQMGRIKVVDVPPAAGGRGGA